MLTKFRKTLAFTTSHYNGNHFVIVMDNAAGRKGRYTTLMWRTGERAKIIGRELTLNHSKQIIDKMMPNYQRLI